VGIAPEIVIPDHLRPTDGRFGSGPSRIRSAQLDALLAANPTILGTSHRQRPVKAEVGRLREGLRTLFNLPDGYEVLLGNGGSTAFWDAATFGLIRDRAQFLSFGEFGAKFAAAAASAPHLGDPDVRTAPAGSAPDFVAVPGLDAYASPHNETSTGVTRPVRRPPGIDDDTLTIIDATSAAGGVAVDPTQFDVYYFAPQKSFGSDGGLWLALVSPRALERIGQIQASGRWCPAFLDLAIALENSRADQTYNTPALATILLMSEQVTWFNAQGGLSWATGRTAATSGHLYGWADAHELTSPFVTDPQLRSPVVVTIDIDSSVAATTLTAVLRANGIVDTEPYRKLGRNQIRIAVFPAVDLADVQALTACCDYVLHRLADA